MATNLDSACGTGHQFLFFPVMTCLLAKGGLSGLFVAFRFRFGDHTVCFWCFALVAGFCWRELKPNALKYLNQRAQVLKRQYRTQKTCSSANLGALIRS